MANKLLKEIRSIIKKREKELSMRENPIAKLECDICQGGIYRPHKIEKWEKELFEKKHKHSLQRKIRRWIKWKW